MRIIQCLAEMMLEEVADAGKYVKKALEWKDNNRALADTFHKLATDELSHMTYLHAEAVKIIDDYRKTNGDPHPAMLAVYDYLHGKQIEQAGIVRGLLAQYKDA